MSLLQRVYLCTIAICSIALFVILVNHMLRLYTHTKRWYGSPGQLLMSRDVSQHPDKLGFLNYTGALQAGDDIKVENGTTVAAAEACVFWLVLSDNCQHRSPGDSNLVRSFHGNGHRLVHCPE